MNPHQHANRAEELAAEAGQMYTDLRRDIEAGTGVDETMWRFLDSTVRLGQLHASLALRTLPTGPSFVPATAAYDDGPNRNRTLEDHHRAPDLVNETFDPSVLDDTAPTAGLDDERGER
ncbi:hypothetical protein AB0G04_43560 [Actinoplanes sp. NPDC023801]|uniref:hypothetical protein n=1 Tax=Actinoplanes sp. NPDC023801 TaxID=3154595 RepID=UPI0033C96E49